MYWDEIKTNEMSMGQIMRMAIKIFKENAKAIIIATFIIFIPINIANALIPLTKAMDNLFMLIPKETNIDYALLDLSAISTYSMELLKWATISMGIQQLFGCIAVMSVAFISYQFIEGNRLDYKFTLEEAFQKWFMAVITILLSTFISIGLYFFLIIPSLIFMIYTNFMLYIVIIKKQKGIAALAYSFKVVKHRFWKTTFRIIGISILQFTMSFIIANIFYYLTPTPIVNFIIDSINIFVSIFFWIVQTIWFLNYDSVEPGKRNVR